MLNPDDELLGIGAAARLTQLSPDTLRRAVKAGRLPSVRTPGGQHRFRRSDIEALAGLPQEAGEE